MNLFINRIVSRLTEIEHNIFDVIDHFEAYNIIYSIERRTASACVNPFMCMTLSLAV